MADETPPRQMSLIPYPFQNGEIVLRRGNAVVVYNANSRELSAHNDAEQSLELAECPYCHRPFHEDGQQDAGDGQAPTNVDHERPFMDPGYFGMLAASQRPSPAGSSGPSTPVTRFVQPALRSGRSRDASGAQGPPTGAEFIGSEPSTSARQGISKSAFSPGFFSQFFRELRVLGKGGNGVVLLVEHIMDRVSLGQFACKRIPVGDDHDWLEKVLLEVKLLQKIPHKNLVAYHWVWLEDYKPSKFGPKIPCLWMLQEYCSGGDLHAYVLGPDQDGTSTPEKLKQKLRRRSRADIEPLPSDLRGPSKLTFDEIFSFFRDITSGLHHLHSKGYIHRDLKPSNCLLQRDGSKSRVLISDFGEVQATGVQRGSTGATGTISYCAPEVLRRDTADGVFGDFTTKSDIFSLGMIVYFMCFGRLPYSSADDINEENEDLDELRAEIMKWPGFDDETRVRPDLPEKLYKYLKRLLSVDPNERPSTDEILASIKGGAGLGDVASLVEENSSRVSSVDSPKNRPSPPGRRQSTTVGRSGFSSLARQNSTDTVRARSPGGRNSGTQSHSQSHSRPTSPIETSMVKIPRKLEIHTSREQSPVQQSPQLMLPPPPQDYQTNRLLNVLHRPNVTTVFRVTAFFAKLLSLTLPCSPYAANAWILYPLIGLAAVDLGMVNFDLRTSVLFVGVHITVFAIISQHSRLCAGKPVVWEDF